VIGLRALIARRPVVGTFLKLPRPEVVSVLAMAGLDFLICDLEHSQMDERDCREVLLAARAEKLPVIVRVAELDRGVINRVLEAGASGVQLARTRTVADAAGLRDLMSYPPVGSRSLSQAQPAARYGQTPLVEYLTVSNETVIAVGQFESADLAGTERLAEAVAALDVAFIGALDLSVDTGSPGDTDSPQVRRVAADVESAAARTGTALGIFVGDAAQARQAIARGYRYVAIGADVSMLAAAARTMVATVEAETSSDA
jgi:2-keto-3-deoxy-L-rhamnonate aldolase RhmA